MPPLGTRWRRTWPGRSDEAANAATARTIKIGARFIKLVRTRGAYGLRGFLTAEDLRDLPLQRANRLGENHLVRGAEIIEIFEAPIRAVTEFRTSPVTDRLILAHLALGMGQSFLGRKA